MKFRNALLAATIVAAAPMAALAQPVLGPYVSLGVGGSYLQDENLKDFTYTDGSSFPGDAGHIRSEFGPMGSAAVGYGLGNGFRAEIQGDYRQNRLQRFGGLQAGGNSEEFGGFVNLLYDFDFGTGISPYIGVGVGYEQQKFQNGRAYGLDASNNAVYMRLNGQQSDVAAQGIVGVAVDVPAVPGLALTAEYRFSAIPTTMRFNGVFESSNGVVGSSFKTDGTYNDAALIGVRYALFQPAPPPPPAPVAVAAPAAPVAEPPRTYLVFFDWDRSDLTSRAREIIGDAAQGVAHYHSTVINVNGYTDLSGTARYNMGLSIRRAKSVEAELVRDGVAQNEIAIKGFGESNPLVPTAKGVREPQNRRVEIILH